jgi:phage portal protein BeeE
MSNGRPGDLFGTQDLALLETPWPNATTGDLLTRAIQDVDLEGNFFATRRLLNGAPVIQRMRPDWVTIVAGGNGEPDQADPWADVTLAGYLYHPGGRTSGRKPVALLPEQVCHFAPVPDPTFRWRGMSWLTPVVREIMSDGAATSHKLAFFEHGATVNLVVTLDADIGREEYTKWVDAFEEGHEGHLNAYKTLYLGAGADAKPVGADMRQMDFKVVQGAGEVRIASAAGVPPVIVGLSEGLQGSSLNAGNFAASRRLFADGTMRPLWRNLAASLAPLVNVPKGAQLYYDDRDIAFLREDRKDVAEIQKVDAETIHTLVIAGFTPTSAVLAVTSSDITALEHSGLYSVQLQPAGTVAEGKGSLVTGTPVPADTGTNSARAMNLSLTREELPRLLANLPDGWVVASINDTPLLTAPNGNGNAPPPALTERTS